MLKLPNKFYTNIDGESYAVLSYASKTGKVYAFKISDVDIWIP